MLHNPDKHGTKKWGVAAKYKPMAREDINFIGDPDLEQIVLEGVVLNELGWLTNKLRNMVGLGDRNPEPKENIKSAPTNGAKARGGTPEEVAINGIIDTLKAADISAHGQTTMLQNIIKYVTKAVGTKLQDPAGRKHEEIISSYVDQMLVKQKGKPEMSMAINVGKMGEKLAKEALQTYKKVLELKGLKATGNLNKATGVFEFIVTPRDPAVKTVGDAAAMAKAGGAGKASTTEYQDLDKTVSGGSDKTVSDRGDAETVSDMGDEGDEGEPWLTPPNGKTIVGYLVMKGHEFPKMTLAVGGGKAYNWDMEKKDWSLVNPDVALRLIHGETFKGVSLKVTYKKPAKKPTALGAGSGPRAIGAGNKGGLVRR